jgi:drug/metabolite transporter (DMT)-like permease
MNVKTLKGYLMILLSAIGFGSYGIWSKFIGAEFGIFFQGWVRSALILIILIPLAYLTKGLKKVDKSDIKWLLYPVIFGIFSQVPLYYAYNHADIGTVTLIFYATFVITSYVIGKAFMEETIGKIKIISLILSFIGLFLIFGLSLAKFSLLALVLAAVNGVASGGDVATTKMSTRKYSSLQVNIYVWLGILLTHFPVSLLARETQIPLTLNSTWLAMLAFAAVGLVSFWLVIEGFKYVDASIGSLVGLMEIIAGVVFGIVIFHEGVTVSKIVGGGIILVAAMLPDLVNLAQRRKPEVSA